MIRGRIKKQGDKKVCFVCLNQQSDNMFLFVSHQQTSPCEPQLAWWEYMKILTSCPVVCSLPRHSRSLYRAGWPAPRKSEWTAQSSAREKKNQRYYSVCAAQEEMGIKNDDDKSVAYYGLHDLVQNIILWSFWQMLGLWYDLILVGMRSFASQFPFSLLHVYISHVEDKICCPGNLCSSTVLHYDAHILSLMWKTVHHVRL